jgi:hypothetical protein
MIRKLLFQNEVFENGFRCADFAITERFGSSRDVQPQPAGGKSERVSQVLSPVFNKLYYKKLQANVKVSSEINLLKISH